MPTATIALAGWNGRAGATNEPAVPGDASDARVELEMRAVARQLRNPACGSAIAKFYSSRSLQ